MMNVQIPNMLGLPILWVGGVTIITVFCADTVPNVKLFTMSQPTLQTVAKPLALPQPVAPPPPVDVILTRETPVELLSQRYETITGTPLLSRTPVPDEPGGAYGFVRSKILSPITDLESVKVGKVHLTGSVVNAVKRKNPLCLLNPFIFAVDW